MADRAFWRDTLDMSINAIIVCICVPYRWVQCLEPLLVWVDWKPYMATQTKSQDPIRNMEWCQLITTVLCSMLCIHLIQFHISVWPLCVCVCGWGVRWGVWCGGGGGGEVKNTRGLKSLKAHEISVCNKKCIFQWMGEIFSVGFQRCLKFHTKYITHTLIDMYFIHRWKFKSS